MIEIFPVVGIGELRPGDDLAEAIISNSQPLLDGDVLVVTSKAISKVEGQLVTLPSDDPIEREAARQRAIDDETVRVVASRGSLRIVADRRGLVLAAAGVDASNVARNELAVLPEDPDASARALRAALHERLGITVGVIISDSLGRAWRTGITDVAIGAAGLGVLLDERGQQDSFGNELQVTLVAVADEIAAAADLAKGKLAGVPVAVLRGYVPPPDDGGGAAALIRPAEEDLFSLGTAEAILLGEAQRASQAGDAVPSDAVPSDAVPSHAVPSHALHSDALRVVAAYEPRDAAEKVCREGMLGFLTARSDAVWRSCEAGHITGSAVILDPVRRRVLLTHHRRLGIWVQMGGHCEPEDHSMMEVAAREAREESGITSLYLDPTPLHLDLHAVTCSLGIPNRHWDIRYLAIAPEDAQAVVSEESLDVRWFDWDALPVGISDGVVELVRRGRERLTQ